MRSIAFVLLISSISAVFAQPSAKWTVLGKEYAVDTLKHCQVGPGTVLTILDLTGTDRQRVFFTTTDLTNHIVRIKTICGNNNLKTNLTIPQMIENNGDKANEYFAGAVSPANAVYGEMLADYALAQGWTKCFISGPSAGDPSDTPRIEAFRAKFEGAGGTVYTETHADSADAALPQIENALTAYPDIDFVYGSGSDYGIAACQALQNMGIDAKVLTSGLDSEALDLLQDGTYMEVVNGDYWVCGTYAALILQNYLDGNPLKDADGNAIWIDDVQPFEVPADQFDLYKQCFLDNPCYSAEELQSMSGISYDDFVAKLHSYSLDERLEANGYK